MICGYRYQWSISAGIFLSNDFNRSNLWIVHAYLPIDCKRLIYRWADYLRSIVMLKSSTIITFLNILQFRVIIQTIDTKISYLLEVLVNNIKMKHLIPCIFDKILSF